MSPACTVRELILIALLGLGAGGGFGAVFGHHILGNGDTGYFPVVAEPVDGDSVRITVVVHLDGYDAPELDARRCTEEHEAAARALERARQLLASGPSRATILGQDRLGRVRARIVTGDRPLGSMLLVEKLVRKAPEPTDWCAAGIDPPELMHSMLARQ